MKKNSIHSQLASNQRMSWGVDDAREGNDEPALAAGDKIPGLPEPLMGYNSQPAEDETPKLTSGSVIDVSNGLDAIPVGTVVDYSGMICVKQADGGMNCTNMPYGEQEYARTKEGDHNTAIVIVPGTEFWASEPNPS